MSHAAQRDYEMSTHHHHKSKRQGARSKCPTRCSEPTNRFAVLRPEKRLCRRGGEEGFNSGVIALNLTRFRKWASGFCSSTAWWVCVVRAQPRNHTWINAEQSVLGFLVSELQPHVP